MTVVSSKEFLSNQKRYFDLAVNEKLSIKRGKNVFHLTCTNVDAKEEQAYLEPDDDLRRAITMDELLERTCGVIDKFFADK
jgi:hypothetical protein